MGCYSAMSGSTWDLDTFCTDEQRRLIRVRAFAMRGSRKFCQGGPNMAFQRGWGGDPDTTVSLRTIIGPPAKSNAFRWRANDGPILNAGSVHVAL